MSTIRSRWAAVGAAVATTLGAGGISLVSATTPSGASTFVPITPCRVIDTRPDFQVGPRSAPLAANDTHDVTATGTTGECEAVPANATGVVLNVTTTDATLLTFLTIWEAGVERPNASSLNPSPGAPPTPNAVTTAINGDGAFSIYNFQGSVHVLADIVGYYTDHHHDDRYYTKSAADETFLPAGGTATDAARLDGNDPTSYRVYYLNVEFDGVSVRAGASSPELAATVITRRSGAPVGHYCVDLPDDGSFAVHGTVGTPVSQFATGLGGTAEEIAVLTWLNDGCLSDGADLSVRLGNDGVQVDAAYVLLVPGL